MKNYIACPYCYANNDCSDINSKECLTINCGECDEEIWEVIPPKSLLYESFYFVLNVLIYCTIIFISAQFFITYPEWRNAAGFVFITSITIASLSLHEFFHAFFAFIFGDFTVYRNRYLRLNILNYIDGACSFMLPAILFMFTGIAEMGAAVYLRLEYVKSAILRSIVYLSGSFSQIIFLSIILHTINNEPLYFSEKFLPLLHVAAGIQLCILIINLLPIPGLDGWNAIFCFLPLEDLNNFLSQNSIFFILIFIFSLFYVDGFSTLLFSPVFDYMRLIGIDERLFFKGFSYIQIINFDTLELIKERLIDLVFKTWAMLVS